MNQFLHIIPAKFGFYLSLWLAVFIPAMASAQSAEASAHSTGAVAPSKEEVRFENVKKVQYIGNNGVTPTEVALGEDDNRALFVDELSFQWNVKQLSGGGRLEFRIYPASPEYVPVHHSMGPDESTRYVFDNDIRLERVWLRHSFERYTVMFGDFPLTLGRGIAFHVGRSDKNAWMDNTLRGAGLEYQKEGVYFLGAYGGVTNSTNVDPVTQSVLSEDPLDSVIALKAHLNLFEALKLGMHGAHVEPRYDSISDIPWERLWIDGGPGVRASTVGSLLELRLGGVSFYTEGNVQSHDNYRVYNDTGVEDETGVAFFSELLWDSGPYWRKAKLSVALQGIFYRHFLSEGTYRSSAGAYALETVVQYNKMPTLELDWVTIRSLGNAVGGRLGGELHLKRSDTRLSLASNLIQYGGGIDPRGYWDQFKDVLVVHPVMGFSQRLFHGTAVLSVDFGGRYERIAESVPLYDRSGFLVHGGVRYDAQLRTNHTVAFESTIRRHRLGVMERNNDFWVSDNRIAYGLMQHWNLSVALQYSDELQDGDKKDLTLGIPHPLPRNWFVNGSIEYQGSGRFESFSTLLTGGSYRGGYECHQGDCRQFPDTARVGLEITYKL